MSNIQHVPLVLALDDAAATLESVGGKGASLARMAAAGFLVPSGFHITTAAYRRFVDQNELQDQILADVSAINTDQPSHNSAGADLSRPSAITSDTTDTIKRLSDVSNHIAKLFAQSAMPDDIAAAISQAYAELGGSAGQPQVIARTINDLPVAVRSSATAEDLPEMSFAGQQETYLNMHGEAMVLDAVKRCWASLWTARAISYRAEHHIASQDVSLAVVVQKLVPASAAGILFTANPLTGARDQMMINAAWGLGEAIVSGQVTPDTFVVDKASAHIIEQQVSTKNAMTVRTPEGTHEEPVTLDQRTQPALSSTQVAELARLGAQIEEFYGQPMDIEWALQDGRIFVVQARPITALPQTAIVSSEIGTAEWQTPDPKGLYTRNSVIELLPDPLSPLFATLGLPAWNKAMNKLMSSIGLGSKLADLITINGYAYYDISSMKKGMRSFKILADFIPAWRFVTKTARQRWEQQARPAYAAIVKRWKATDLSATSATQLLDGARETVNLAAEYYLTIQSGILPSAYMSESLFTLFYDRLVKRRRDPSARTFVLGYKSSPIQAEQSLYDLAQWARMHEKLAEALSAMPAPQFTAAYHAPLSAGIDLSCTSGTTSGPTDTINRSLRQVAGVDDAVWSEFRQRFAAHLRLFGHVIYDLDFAKAVPADNPTALLETLKFFLSGLATDPHKRQEETASMREHATRMLLARLKGDPRMPMFRKLLRWAQDMAPLREDALADAGLGWPIVRRILREIGQRLVKTHAIDTQDDIFSLTLDEVQEAALTLDNEQPPATYQKIIAERQATWKRQSTVTPPVALPVKGGVRLFGIDWSSMMPAQTGQKAGDTIKGIGASTGRISGLARVIHGPEEFDQMRPGDILIARITTPAWTPLFALAAGVVTDVGGPLSHSSIVAREYHIPAVLGTGVATERLHSGQQITVDGDAGTITIQPSQDHNVEEWNDSLSGDYLWTNGNLGEAVPDVMTPCTWSLMLIFMSKALAMTSLNGHRLVGNIGGRCYMNLSLTATIASLFGMGQKRFREMIEGVFGHIPDDMEIPLIPTSRSKLLLALLPEVVRIRSHVRTNTKKIPAFMETAQTRCEKLRTRIQQTTRPEDLIALWKNDLEPFFHESCYILQAAGRQDNSALLRVRLELRKLVGEADANALLSRQSELASLGPLLSLSRLACGEIDRETFAQQYGHRGPHEFEVSIPRPAEDPDWIDKQLAGLRAAPVDVPTLLERQKAVQEIAWERFRQRYPREAAKMRHRIDKVIAAIRDREATRSEVIRVFWVLRTFILRASDLSGHGEDLFFLTLDEILAVLGGDETPLASIPTCRTTYERYHALPPYPALIRGHFDPFKWAANPQRRSDLFDEHDQSVPIGNATITGFPGAPGIVEGRVRVIGSVEEGDQLQPGEVLVTIQTNIGWTPLFPRAAAIITDVGAPLSHAAIVARELGIPAVVGSGNATMLLHTGDMVRVNGEKGTVEVLSN